MKTIKKIFDGLDRVLKVFVFVIIVVMTFSTFMQVVGRYVMDVPLPWTEELSRRMMTWLLFIASAVAYRAGGMMGIDIVVRLFPDYLKRIVAVFTNALITFFGGFMIAQGFSLADKAVFQISSALDISMYYVYLIIPFSGFLFVIYSVEMILNNIFTPKGEGK